LLCLVLDLLHVLEVVILVILHHSILLDNLSCLSRRRVAAGRKLGRGLGRRV